MNTRTATRNLELETIPGVGPSIACDLKTLGIRQVSDLKGGNPEKLYEMLCQIQGVKVDICVLYIFRCAVYFSEHPTPEPELLKWWNWKNKLIIRP